MSAREETTALRRVAAVQIPDGTSVQIDQGTRLFITQELGGNFTVMTENGAMLRIDQRNADALGKEVEVTEIDLAVAEDPEAMEERIWEQMKRCYDPEIPVNIVDLGLVYDCQLSAGNEGGQRVTIKMTLTAPGCGMGPVLADDVRARVKEVPGVEEVEVELVFDPPWNQNMMSDVARLQLGFF
jgi:probable FeS assembly SUF system protein SufT